MQQGLYHALGRSNLLRTQYNYVNYKSLNNLQFLELKQINDHL